MKRVGLAVVAGVCLFVVTAARAQTPFGGDDTGCVPDTSAHLKCSNAIAKGFGKLVKAVGKCHNKQASLAFKGTPADDETCEMAAKAKFDAAVSKVSGICSAAVLSGAGAEESVLLASAMASSLSLDAQSGAVYCDGTTPIDGTGEDAGKIASSAVVLKCENAAGKSLTKLAGALIKCHTKMASVDFKAFTSNQDESGTSCEGTALTKYDAAVTKNVGSGNCPSCLGMAQQEALAHSPTTGVEAQVDGANSLVYPCPASTTTTTTTSTTTTTTAAGLCCGFSPKPSTLSFTTGIGSGNCGTVQSSTGAVLKNLACSGLYTGGGLNSVPLPYAVPDQGVSLTGVSSCNNTTHQLTLANLTSAQTGSNRNCTSVGCLFGPPLPIPNSGSTPTSVCVINIVSTNATGSADCSTGASHISLPLTSQLYLDGDLYPNAPGIQVCPVCNKTCTGGTNATGPCNTNTDCPGGGTCGGSNVCHSGAGRPGDGNACTPADSATLGTTNSFPTSQDCPPDPALGIGGLPIAFDLITGMKSKTAATISGQSNVFCGFCRDVTGGGSNCFEGDPNPSCPHNAGCAAAGVPDPCCTGLGTGSCDPQAVTACTSTAQCTNTGFPDCVQRDPGAFGPAGGGAHTINETGSPAGNMTDGAGHASILASIFCIQPTFNATVDAAGDLPAPGAVTLSGTAQLLP